MAAAKVPAAPETRVQPCKDGGGFAQGCDRYAEGILAADRSTIGFFFIFFTAASLVLHQFRRRGSPASSQSPDCIVHSSTHIISVNWCTWSTLDPLASQLTWHETEAPFLAITLSEGGGVVGVSKSANAARQHGKEETERPSDVCRLSCCDGLICRLAPPRPLTPPE